MYKAAAPGRKASSSVCILYILIKSRTYFRKYWECVSYVFNFKHYFHDCPCYKLVMEYKNRIVGHFLHTFFMSSVFLQFMEEENTTQKSTENYTDQDALRTNYF